MLSHVAISTKGQKIPKRVTSLLASLDLVVDLQILCYHPPAAPSKLSRSQGSWHTRFAVSVDEV